MTGTGAAALLPVGGPRADTGTLDTRRVDSGRLDTGPLDTGQLDADLGDALVGGLLGPAPVDLAGFEQAFIAAVERGCADPGQAWDRFYDATLARLVAGPLVGNGTVASFSRIWAGAQALTRGSSVLDVGTCFGFLPLAWASRRGHPRLLAADLSPGSAALAGRQARRLGLDVAVLCADGTALPLRDRAVDTVLLLHILEHLPPGPAGALLAEAMRVARRRVVVAVPVEARPDPRFGHVQVFDVECLSRLGRSTGWDARACAGDGAWLVLDRPGHACSAAGTEPRPAGRCYICSRPSWPLR